MNKTCTKCGENKDLNDFSKDNRLKSGYRSTCKSCVSTQHKSFRKTKMGLIRQIYDAQIHRSKRRHHPPPKYKIHELENWLFNQAKFHILYDNWVKSGYDKKLFPSCDRIKNNLPYTFDNLQLMTWDENNKKEYIQIIQYNEEGAVVNEFTSIAEAKRQTNVKNIISNKLFKRC